jgi:hypothetical protein
VRAHVVGSDEDRRPQADTIFADDRLQAVVAGRVSGGELGYGTLDLSLMQAVVDTANARGFELSTVTPLGEHVLLLFDPFPAAPAEA